MRIDVDADFKIILSEIFSGIGIKTTEGVTYGVCLRDSGLEIICPDGTFVSVKRNNYEPEPQGGETYVEIDGRQVT